MTESGILRAEVARIVHTEILKAFGGSHVDLARLERRVEELEKGSGPPDFKAQVLEALKDPEVARAVYIIVNGELEKGLALVEAMAPEAVARIIAVRAADTVRLNQEGKHHD